MPAFKQSGPLARWPALFASAGGLLLPVCLLATSPAAGMLEPGLPRADAISKHAFAPGTPPAEHSVPVTAEPVGASEDVERDETGAETGEPEAPAQPWVQQISGALSVTSGGRALRASEAANAIVYFRPAQAVPAPPMEVEQIMATRRKQFLPRALPITPGTSVRFPNNDPILHNTFSTVPGNEFDTGLYGQGDGVAHVFRNTGHVRVYCNVHHTMIGHVLVMDTPFFTNPDGNGRFTLAGLPAGDGELFIWHERAPLWRQAIDPSSSQPLTIELELSTRRVPQHMNKFGQPYRRRGDSEY